MTTKVKRRWVRGAALALAAAAGATAACNGDDNGVTPQYVYDSGSPPDSTVGDAPITADAPTIQYICNSYGGAPGVAKLASDIFAAVGADCRIGAHFAAPALDATGQAHLTECFTKQLQYFMGCPGVTYDGSKDSSGNTCRSMSQAHQNLNLRKADFDAFIADMIGSLTADNVSKTDVSNLIFGTFNGYEAAVVRNNGTGNSDCTCPGGIYDGGSCYAPDAGDAGDAREGGGDGGGDGGGGGDTGSDSGGGQDAADAGGG